MNLPFEFIDVVVVAIIVVSGLLAYFRGLVREVLSLATWIGAALGAVYALPYARPYAREIISVQLVADVLTGIGLFLVMLVALTFFNHLLSSRVKDSALGAIDRGLGFLFGLARGALLVSVGYIAATWFMDKSELDPYLADARTAPYIREGADLLLRAVPNEMKSESRAAAGNAADTTKKVLEAKKLLDGLQGGGASTDTSGQPPAYNRSERREMQRLIDSKQ